MLQPAALRHSRYAVSRWSKASLELARSLSGDGCPPWVFLLPSSSMRYPMLVGAVLVLGTTGCSDRPSESLAREVFSHKIDDGHSTRLRVVEFAKSDGQSSELAAVKMYNMTFAATLEFAEDAFYTTGGSIMQPEVSINTASIANVPPTCAQNFAACVSQTPMRAAKGDKLKVKGTASFEKSESGWHVSNLTISLPDCADVPGCASSSSGQSPRRGSMSSTPAPVARMVGNTGGVDTVSVSGKRCAAFGAAHPEPRRSIIDRILRRPVGIAGTLTAHPIRIGLSGEVRPDTADYRFKDFEWAEGSVGQIAYLASGELCIGPAVLLSLSDITQHREYYYVTVTQPINDKGWRILNLNEVDRGLTYAWIVHPDSSRAISGDLLAKFHVYPDGTPAAGISQMQFSLPKPQDWSPDGRYLALSAGNIVDRGLLITDLQDRSTHYVSVQGFLQKPPMQNCWNEGMGPPEWSAADVLQVDVAYHYESEGGEHPKASCARPAEMTARLMIDLGKYSAARLR